MYIRRKAYNFLIDLDINALPVDIESIYKKKGWFLDSFEAVENLTHIIRPILVDTNNCDAVTANYSGHYITLFNESILPLERQFFSKFHECSHIICEHLKANLNTKFEDQDENILNIYEREADIVAAHLIAPLPVLYFAGIRTVADIQRLSGLSYQAAVITADKLRKFLPKQDDIEKSLVRQFFNFIIAQPTNILGITKGSQKTIILPIGYIDFTDWMYVVYNIKKADNPIYQPLTSCYAGYVDKSTLIVIPPNNILYNQINSESTKDFIRYIIRKSCGIYLDVSIMPLQAS